MTRVATPPTDESPDRTDEARSVFGNGRPGRIAGIDIARGLAILGMFTVHVQIPAGAEQEIGGVTEALLSAPGGRASVLFFLLSGVSLSLIAGRGSLSAAAGVLRRRGVALLLVGLVLSGAAIWEGSILEHYGVMFLLAPWLLLAGNRLLTALGVGGILLGPIALLMVRPFSDEVHGLSDGALGEVLDTAWSLGVDGLYPLLVWFGFFALGMRLGRLDLRAPGVGVGMLAAGAALAIAVPVVVGQFEQRGVENPEFSWAEIVDGIPGAEARDGPALAGGGAELGTGSGGGGDGIDRDLRRLLDTTEHSGRTAWAVQAAAIAVAILGAALLLPRKAQRLLWPLAAVGSISLSAYLFHIILVTDVWDAIVGEGAGWGTGEQILILVGLELGLVLLAMAVVWRWRSGPAERALRWLSRR